VTQRLSLTAPIVDDYDDAIGFYVDQLGFELQEDTLLSDGKRWVVVLQSGAGLVSC
jgi:catechol 2,3-dioxygenase-like lactoylglutathione lyase family enzyme